ncbi:RNA polymerase sigma factor [Alicyclobacillus sp. ALC3]|uniref:RNA polymerase sigma factor n=1 Tax=Alicyclobacillus sp. ALC3 TaxID=2796143 RepID=UPI0023781D0C|nr:RNA polymerase sigma factor [Alicyclobacillus sp. ALC3]WDL95816.1 RNA polymerase sigma factor [Alicyclobacillus sp. ALC3]
MVQEVFLRAFRAWSTYRREANAKTFILRIARNHIYDVLRKRRTERNFLLSTHPPHVSHDASSSVDTRLQVEEALSQLKVEYRQVIALRHVEGRSVPETAQILGWSDAKVRTTTNRALAKLRDILGGDEARDAGRQGV